MDVSIVVPIYNVEAYLKDCMDSLLNQDFDGEYEIVGVNDGSTDNSLDILETYGKEHDKVVVIDQKNKGLSGARNTGFENAKGKYVMFIDSDDYFANDKVLSMLFAEAEKHELDFVFADFEFDYDDKRKNHRIKRAEAIKNKVMAGRELYDSAIETDSVMSVVWNKLYKKEFLVKNNLCFYEGIIYEDMEFTPRAFYLADRVKYLDQVIVMYRQREGSIMNSANFKRLGNYIVVADSLRQFNEKFDSRVLDNSELYLYVTVIRKLRLLENKMEAGNLIDMLKQRKVTRRFLQSEKMKYKVFGLLYSMQTVVWRILGA